MANGPLALHTRPPPAPGSRRTPTPRPLAFALALALLCRAATGDATAAKKKKPAPKPAASAVCTDFYAEANSAWLKANPMPASGAISSLGQLSALALQQQRDLLDAAMNAPQGNAETAGRLLGERTG